MIEKEIYRKAIDLFGDDSQMDMLIEEMAELTQAILKNRRRKLVVLNQALYTENLHEEFVDVKIVMAQIELCLNPEMLEFWKTYKLGRLEERINNHDTTTTKKH